MSRAHVLFTKWRSDRRGTALVEIALIFPFLVLLTFGTMEIGSVIYQQHVITKGVQEAARYAARSPSLIETATCVYPSFPAKIEVMGDQGSVTWELGAAGFRLWEFADKTPAPTLPPDPPWETYHARQFEDFVGAIRGDREPLVNGEEGRRAVSVIRALYDSARTGEPVAPA